MPLNKTNLLFTTGTLTAGKASDVPMHVISSFLQSVQKSPIQFNYLNGNCHNRAHIISAMAKKAGIQPVKIWAFAPAKYSRNDDTLICLEDKNRMAPNNIIEWGYHVAPVIKSGKQILVIDPALYPERPVPFKEWVSALKTPNLAYIFLDAGWYLFNSVDYLSFYHNEACSIHHSNGHSMPAGTGSFNGVITGDFWKYEGEAHENNDIARGLAIDETAYTFIVKEVAALRKSLAESAGNADDPNHEMLQDYKKLVGVITNFETVFRDSQSNEDINTAFLSKYASVIEKYKALYTVNVTKWKKYTQRLPLERI